MNSSRNFVKMSHWLRYVLFLQLKLVTYLAAGSPAGLEQRGPRSKWDPIEPRYIVAKGNSPGSCERHREDLQHTFAEATYMARNAIKAIDDVKQAKRTRDSKSSKDRRIQMLLALFKTEPHEHALLEEIQGE